MDNLNGKMDAMIDKSKKAGAILKSLLHAKTCRQGRDCLEVPNCPALKALLAHSLECRLRAQEVGPDGLSCRVSGCKTVRHLLDHMLCCQAATDLARAQGRPLVGCIVCTVAGVEKFKSQLAVDTSLAKGLASASPPQRRHSGSSCGSSGCGDRDSGEWEGTDTSGLGSSPPLSSSGSFTSVGSFGSMGSFGSLASLGGSTSVFEFAGPGSPTLHRRSLGASSSSGLGGRGICVRSRDGVLEESLGDDDDDEGGPACIATFRPSWLAPYDHPLQGAGDDAEGMDVMDVGMTSLHRGAGLQSRSSDPLMSASC